MAGLRDYGLGNYTRYIISRPYISARFTAKLGGHQPECPNCGIEQLCEVQVVLENMPLLRTRYGVGTYLSCPACPWAGPMVVIDVDGLPEWFRPYTPPTR